MENQTISSEHRQKAVDWIKSKARDIDQGLSILKDASYKPHVVVNFEKNKTRRDIPRKLENQIRLYIRYCTNPVADNPIHFDEVPFFDPEKGLIPDLEKFADREYPPIIKRIVTECSDLYKHRSMLHKDMKAVGEQNDEESMAKRKSIYISMDTASRRLDVLYGYFKEYKKDGTIPPASIFDETLDDTFQPEDSPKEDEKELLMPEDLAELKKMQNNWRTKILKANNQLEYQLDKKGKKPNPMPDGPKRILKEKHLARLEKEKEAIDLKVAELS